jgi:hypothetical protein
MAGIYTFRFSVPADQQENPTVVHLVDPDGRRLDRALSLPVLECESCGALIAADKQTTHDFFHNMLDLAIQNRS